MRHALLVMTAVVSAVVGVAAVPAAAAPNGSDVRVSVGSPPGPFSQNKQNEPTITHDANNPSILVAGSNDEIDEEPCNSGADNTCPFTPGIGVSGVYFSFNGGATWTQPTYTGLTARNCPDTVGADSGCAPSVGPIGTLPWYYEHGLVSDGDPAVAIGPKPGAHGFAWNNGERLYYANLTSNLPSGAAFPGFEAIAVSRTDHMRTAASGGAAGKNAWDAPVVISRQSNTTFSDKEQIWADNASSSRFFGNVYVCWAAFRGQEKGNAAPAPLQVAVSRDGGTTWKQHQVSPAANNGQVNPADGCTIRTDSTGNAYLFGVGTSSSGGHQAYELMSLSTNGGQTWSPARRAVGPVTQPGAFDPVQGRPVIDGVAGARSDLAVAPSVDIANGAPSGADATNRMVMSYVSGSLAKPDMLFTESTNGGQSWGAPRAIESAGDRGLFTAPAISPNGTDVYVVYNAFTTPFRTNTTDSRSLVGVVLHADSSTNPAVPTSAFSQLHRGMPGDPRGSSANSLTSEFLGDYVYATATRTYGAAVWNDARNASDCPAVDAWRMALQNGDTSAPPPAPEQDCRATFGNTDIYGGAYSDPTP
jgi:hypothetical protein